ncbi:MAG: aryl-sulfate sulfotransferase [Ignavibacteriales bacterium]|nr:aryl-sulfate sulfotransferase [Ignavibacteriales bacterium]
MATINDIDSGQVRRLSWAMYVTCTAHQIEEQGMNFYGRVLTIVCAIVLLVQSSAGQQLTRYQYVFPKPDSRYVSTEAIIILRPGREIERSSVSASLISVKGSQSGLHRGTMILSDDQRTMVFNPREPFVENERVSVDVTAGLRGTDGSTIGGVSFRFATSIAPPSAPTVADEQQPPATGIRDGRTDQRTFVTAGDSIPADFPPLRVDTVNNPASGELFLGVFSGIGGASTYANYLIVADNRGKPLAYKRIGTLVNPFAYMFKADPTGLYSYIDRTPTATNIRIVDSTFAQVDTYPRGNPATASHADFLLLPNGHALVLYFDVKTIDMSKIVQGGHPAASVMGNLIQEFDINKNVVFQWSSFDYLPITDTYEDTLAASFDYSHANTLSLDQDGNMLLSNRHMSEVTKVDRNTGEIIWRLGGKRNQFTFLNEHSENSPLYFSYPHHIQRLANGNIIMFDNGNQRKTKYSRVVEYRLDETNKIATLAWEYRHTPDIYASAQGSVQRFANGNTLIGWGDASLQGQTAITEIRSDNTVAFELSLPAGYRSMRVYRLSWKSMTPAATYTRYELLQGNTYSFNDTTPSGRTGVRLKFNEMSTIPYNSAMVQRFSVAPAKPQFAGRSPWMASQRVTIAQFGISTLNADISFDAAMIPGIPAPDRVTVFQRETIGTGTFSPLSTSYNTVRNEIVATTSKLGEFIFCWGDNDTLASAPILVSPAERDSVNQKLPLALVWDPKGYVTGFHVQVALDSLFRTLVLNDSLLTSPADTLKGISSGTKYYWRVRSRNYGQTSAWSAFRRFSATAPYIAILSPNGREVWQRGQQFFVKWVGNINDRVRIDLYRGSGKQSTVKDSVTNLGAYAWTIPSSLAPDTTYRIRVTSVADSSLFSTSAGMFSVISGSTGVEARDQVAGEFALSQNYPNPFNPRTAISYQLLADSFVRLVVFDVLGREISTLANNIQQAGTYLITWDASAFPSGVYFYRLNAQLTGRGEAGGFVATKKMVYAK